MSAALASRASRAPLRAAACLGLALACLGADASAVAAQGGDFWREVREPGWRRSRTFLRQGMQHMNRAAPQLSAAERRVIFRNARVRFLKAREQAPTDPEALFYYAWATEASSDPRSRDLTLVDEAISAFEALRALAPQYREDRVAERLGILYTRKSDFGRAVEEYQRAIDRAVFGPETIVIFSNMAEVTMLAGNLELAAVRYEHALRLMDQYQVSSAVALAQAQWGLAIVQDRLGERTGAVEMAARAVSTAGMGLLTSEDFFFEPPEELYYYQALGHLAQASADGTPVATRVAELRRAQASFRQFLAEGGDDSPWAELARDHVTRLDERLASLGAGRRGRSARGR